MDKKILIIALLIMLISLSFAKEITINKNFLKINSNIYNKYSKIALRSKEQPDDYINKKIDKLLKKDYSEQLLEEAKQKIAYIDNDKEQLKNKLECLGDYIEDNLTTEEYQHILNDELDGLSDSDLEDFIKC